MHIKNLLFGPPNKWIHLAIYWLGHKFRNIKPEYASNTFPHSEHIPPFYQIAYTHFSQIHNDQIIWVKINTKQAYNFFAPEAKTYSKNSKQTPRHRLQEACFLAFLLDLLDLLSEAPLN